MNHRANNFSPRRRLVFLLGAALAVAACGKKGPLYLPDETQAPNKTGTAVAKPASPQPGK